MSTSTPTPNPIPPHPIVVSATSADDIAVARLALESLQQLSGARTSNSFIIDVDDNLCRAHWPDAQIVNAAMNRLGSCRYKHQNVDSFLIVESGIVLTRTGPAEATYVLAVHLEERIVMDHALEISIPLDVAAARDLDAPEQVHGPYARWRREVMPIRAKAITGAVMAALSRCSGILGILGFMNDGDPTLTQSRPA